MQSYDDPRRNALPLLGSEMTCSDSCFLSMVSVERRTERASGAKVDRVLEYQVSPHFGKITSPRARNQFIKIACRAHCNCTGTRRHEEKMETHVKPDFLGKSAVSNNHRCFASWPPSLSQAPVPQSLHFQWSSFPGIVPATHLLAVHCWKCKENP